MLMADIFYLPVTDISVEFLLTGIDCGTLPSLCRHTTCVVRVPDNTFCHIGTVALIGFSGVPAWETLTLVVRFVYSFKRSALGLLYLILFYTDPGSRFSDSVY